MKLPNQHANRSLRGPFLGLFAAIALVGSPIVAGGCAELDGGPSAPATYNTDTGASSGGSSSGASSSSGSSSSGASSGGSSSGGSSSGGNPLQFPDGEPLEAVNNKAYYDRALLVMNTAEKQLDIVQFEAKSSLFVDNFGDAIEAAHKRGVTVRVLLDDEVEDNVKLRKRLSAAGVAAKIDSAALRTHCKIVRSEKAALLGSTNWSQTSMTKNNEANLLIRHDAARATIAEYIDKLWSNSASHYTVMTSTSSQAAVYSDKGYKDIAIKLIDKAEEHIEIVAYAMNLDPNFKTGPVQDVIARIEKRMASKPKLKVRVLLDQSPWSEINTDINKTAVAELKKRGIDARLDDPDTITHAKVLIVDGKVVLGTNNWGKGGFELYHEIGIRTSLAPIQTTMLKYFDEIWESSK